VFRIGPWLRTIKFYAPKSPIIIVGTHLDTVKKAKKDKVEFLREEIGEKFSNFKMLTGTKRRGMKFFVRGTFSPVMRRVLLLSMTFERFTVSDGASFNFVFNGVSILYLYIF
jgi:hypothetical protein